MVIKGLVLLLCVFPISPALADWEPLTDMGRGVKQFYDSHGRHGTIIDLGGGNSTYTDNTGATGTIIDLSSPPLRLPKHEEPRMSTFSPGTPSTGSKKATPGQFLDPLTREK